MKNTFQIIGLKNVDCGLLSHLILIINFMTKLRTIKRNEILKKMNDLETEVLLESEKEELQALINKINHNTKGYSVELHSFNHSNDSNTYLCANIN